MRRGVERVMDQGAARLYRRLFGGGLEVPFDGQPKLALLTVNFSTTRWLKLMLRTLVEQDDLDLLKEVVICDNRSRDGGLPFLRGLAERAGRVSLVENRWWDKHARGMRLALAALDRLDEQKAEEERANVWLAIDTDVIWLRPDALKALAGVFEDGSAAFAGELRRHLYPLPEAQASFLAVRRDWAARRKIAPWMDHANPAWPLQRDLWKGGGKGVDFRSNQMGYALHRGRSGVAAAKTHVKFSYHATTPHPDPHYMGVPGGEQIWRETEERYAEWLEPQAEERLIALLAERLA